jgi:acetylornithine deacetylase
MLNGHLDNDSLTASWDWNPYEPRVLGNQLWGAGIHNMKSGVAAMLAAAVAVKRSGVTLRGDLVIACVVGELQGGKGTLHLLQSGVTTDYAVVPEPYSIERIITKSAGVHKCSITIIGRSVHTSRSETGVDAIQKMIGVIQQLGRLDLGVYDAELPGVPRLLVASIIGGRSRDYDLAGPSNISDVCTIIIDLRYPRGIEPSQIDTHFVDLLTELQAEDSDLQWEYNHPPDPRFQVGGADMPPMVVPKDSQIVRIIRENDARVLGGRIHEVGVVAPYSYCGNDTAHLSRAGIECCLYGPRGYPEDVEKHVRIDEMLDCARVLVGSVVSICR